MSEFKTMEDFYKDDHTVVVDPLTMAVFSGMLSNQPLEFTYKGTTFSIQLGEDVKMIFDGMVELIHGSDKFMQLGKDATGAEKLAFEYARRVGALMDKDKTSEGDDKNGRGHQQPDQS